MPELAVGEQHARVISGPMGNRLIGRERLAECRPLEAMQHRIDHRHSRRTAGTEHRQVQVRCAFAVGVDQVPRDLFGALHEVLRQLLELLAFDLVRLAATAVLCDQGGPGTHRQAPLALFDLPGQMLQALGVAPRVVAEFTVELFGDGVQQALVPVDAPQVQVARAGDHLDLVFLVTHQRQVECSAPEIVDENPLLVGQFREPQPFRPQDIAQRRRDRFVDDVDLLEPRRATGFEGGQALPLAELRGDGDHGLFDRPDLPLRVGQQLAQDRRRNIGGRVGFSVDRPRLLGIAHPTLGVLDDMCRIHDRVAQRLGPDDLFPLVVHHHRRGRNFTLLVGNRDRLVLLVQVGNARIGGSQVDSDGVWSGHFISANPRVKYRISGSSIED